MKFIKKLTEQIRRHPIISFVIFLLLVAVVLIALVKNGLISECSRHYLKTNLFLLFIYRIKSLKPLARIQFAFTILTN